MDHLSFNFYYKTLEIRENYSIDGGSAKKIRDGLT